MTFRNSKKKLYLRRHLRALEAIRAAVMKRKRLIWKKERSGS